LRPPTHNRGVASERASAPRRCPGAIFGRAPGLRTAEALGKYNRGLGTAGDLIAGVLIGFLVRVNMPVLGSAAVGVSVVAVIDQVVAGFVGGALLTIVVGLGKDMLSAPRPG
jgi:hypothetical protein